MGFNRASARPEKSVAGCGEQRQLPNWRTLRRQDAEFCYPGGLLRAAAQGVEADARDFCAGRRMQIATSGFHLYNHNLVPKRGFCFRESQYFTFFSEAIQAAKLDQASSPSSCVRVACGRAGLCAAHRRGRRRRSLRGLHRRHRPRSRWRQCAPSRRQPGTWGRARNWCKVGSRPARRFPEPCRPRGWHSLRRGPWDRANRLPC